MSQPTTEELKILPIFRKRLEDLGLDEERNGDYFLLRWLRARELNLGQAEDMLRKSLKWRKEHDVDSVLQWEPPEIFTKEFPFEIDGVDKDNSPVFVMPFGRWDLKKLVQAGYRDDLVRYMESVFEGLEAKMRGKLSKVGTPLTQFVVVVDTDHLAMRTLLSFGVIDAVLEIVRNFEANHPEVLKAAYVVNATKVFTYLFAAMKPFLSQRTFGKITIFGSDQSKWKPCVHNQISPEQLPVMCGGTNLTKMDKLIGLSELDMDGDESAKHGVKCVTVGPGVTIPVEIKVPDQGCALIWKFKTKDHDISYSVKFGDEMLFKQRRVDSHLKSVEGSIICKQAGVYTLWFDNSFSRMKSKVVKYVVAIEGEKN